MQGSRTCAPAAAGTLTTVLGAALGGNPTASVGLTAVNGTATTYLRSDSAPALSQAIIPTWTGQHAWTQTLLAADSGYSFSGATNMTFSRSGNTMVFTTAGTERARLDANGLRIFGPLPACILIETDAAADEGAWRFSANSRAAQHRALNDAGTLAADYLTATRAAGATPTITAVSIGNSTDTPATTCHGAFTAPRVIVSASTVATNGVYLPAANAVGLSANSTLTARYTSTTFETILQTLFSGVTSPAQFTANQNDLAVGNVTVVRASSDASRNVSGIAGGAAGRFLIFINVGAQPIVLTNDDAASTAANRFLLASGTSTTIQAGGACIL